MTPKLDTEIFHHMEKFNAISPTYPDDISQNTRNFWPVYQF